MAFKPTEHPVLGLPSKERVAELLATAEGTKKLQEYLTEREKAITRESQDPYHYGYVIKPSWVDANRLLAEGNDLLILGGNRSSKTEFAGKSCMETLYSGDGKAVWAFHSTEPASVERQQPYLYRYMWPEHRQIGKQSIAYVKYHPKTGFSDNSFMLPNSSRCRFLNYMMDISTLEGSELDKIWCDELVPVEFLDTLRYRIMSRNGKMLVTFTPLEGYSMTVAQYLDGARVIESRPAPLLPQDEILVRGCPRGHMPYILQCHKTGRYVIFFFSEWNPYPMGFYRNMQKMLDKSPKAVIMVRAYGYTEKMTATAFPKFGDVHIVEPDVIPKNGTNYMVFDNHGARNWFMMWARVDDLGRVYIYREWPDISVGDWALSDKRPDGKAGPGQFEGAGRGTNDYKRLVWELEGADLGRVVGRSLKALEEKTYRFRQPGADSWDMGGDVIMERYIDPRAGTATVPGKEEGTSVIELMAEEETDGEKMLMPSMSVMPAPAAKVDEGTGLINNWLSYDAERPVTMDNCPKLYVSRNCVNTIYALRTWTGMDGEKGATKDPVDCLKMLAKADIQHYEGEMCQPGRGF
jgi:hypothetical protein